MNCLIATDSFKGSLTSIEAAACVQEGILRVFPDAEITIMPVADGGEGTVETILAGLSGKAVWTTVLNPLGKPVDAMFAILETGEAVIEMAKASGLLLVDPKERNILSASTYGTGQLIKKALDMGCRKICIGIGGSATNDAGAGMAQALGVHFLSKDGKELSPGGGALGNLDRIDCTQIDPRLKETEVIVMCDVNNPLCGQDGASRIYGPQKGATPSMVLELDKNLSHYADIVKRDLNIDAKDYPGAGAAGGLGMGLMCFAGAKLVRGIDTVLDLSMFDEKMEKSDVIITGEGKLDQQTMRGKVIYGVLERCEKAGKPVIAICGRVTDEGRQAFGKRFRAIVAAADETVPLNLAIKNAKTLLTGTTERIIKQIYVK
ncbi:MAG: glycerate kinase [Clostridia bacterium]|nr:glycerate kinase [Clostridia bacterium]